MKVIEAFEQQEKRFCIFWWENLFTNFSGKQVMSILELHVLDNSYLIMNTTCCEYAINAHIQLVSIAIGIIAIYRHIIVARDHVGVAYSTHFDGAVRAATVLGDGVLVVATAHGGEVVLGDRLGVVDDRAAVSTRAGKVNTAARLGFTAIGVEGTLTDGLQESQSAAVGLNGLDIVSIGGAESLTGRIVAEEWQSRIQTNDGMNLSILDVFASIARHMSTQTVPNDHGVTQVQAVVVTQEIDQVSDLFTNSGNSRNR